jgi:hypothetical protein
MTWDPTAKALDALIVAGLVPDPVAKVVPAWRNTRVLIDAPDAGVARPAKLTVAVEPLALTVMSEDGVSNDTVGPGGSTLTSNG